MIRLIFSKVSSRPHLVITSELRRICDTGQQKVKVRQEGDIWVPIEHKKTSCAISSQTLLPHFLKNSISYHNIASVASYVCFKKVLWYPKLGLELQLKFFSQPYFWHKKSKWGKIKGSSLRLQICKIRPFLCLFQPPFFVNYIENHGMVTS